MAIFNYIPLLIWTLGMFYLGNGLNENTGGESHAKITYWGMIFWWTLGSIFTALKI